MKRFALQVALAVTAAFTLVAAAPALACGADCGDCPMHKAAAADPKAGAGSKAAPDDKAAPKKDAKPAEKGAPAAAPAGDKKAEAVPPCKCEKGGKGCICKKGECTCPNCGAAKVAAGEQPKPKCDCAGGKDCGCTKNEKGECTCKKGATKPKAA